jgi:dipeptidyl aminopeptidase/acylaminoacyl peptidase
MRELRRSIRFAGAFPLLLAAPVGAQTAAFTIEQVLGAPFPTELIAAPAKGRIAWVFNARGSRNVWVAEPGADGSYAARAVTTYSGDDGQEVGDLAWSPDGETIVYVRGSLTPGEGTNPRSLPSGDLGQEIYAVSVHGGAPRKLGDGHAPTVSPKGDIVAYESGGHIWAAHLDGSSQPESLISEKGRSGSLRWSPDGSKLAFVSARGDHDFVGVYDPASKSVVWLAPSVDHDGDPEWSPDGSRVAFVRVPTGGPDVFLEGRTGHPWSIWIADVTTGDGHAMWTADNGAGSLYQPLVADHQLFWGVDDRIVFPWEKTGWLHLYSIRARGGNVVEMTPGDFEIFTASLNPNRQDIVYAGNANDSDRQHVWRVGVGSNVPVELTPGTGIESYPVVASDGKTIAVLRSDARRPMHPAIVTGAVAVHDLATEAIPTDFPSAQLVVPQPVIFSSGDGMMIHGQLFLPAGSGRHPAVVFLHGGPTRQMLLGWHMKGAYSYLYGVNQYLASQGFVVLSVNYRGGIGYGLNFRKPANFGAKGASENQDLQGAGLFLRGRPDVDPARIGVWGLSYGGLMTAQALSRYSDLFAAGVDYAGVHDWRALLFPPPADTTRDDARVAFQSSPMAAVRGWRSPVLIAQADDDRDVPYAQAPELVTALRAQGVDLEQIILPDETHEPLVYRHWIRFFQATAEYLTRHLIARQAAAH